MLLQKVQLLFGGAYVWVPQPDFLDAKRWGNRQKVASKWCVSRSVIALIQEYVAKNPKIDPFSNLRWRISNGGYSPWSWIISTPEYSCCWIYQLFGFHNENSSSDCRKSKNQNLPCGCLIPKMRCDKTRTRTVYHYVDRPWRQAGRRNCNFTYYASCDWYSHGFLWRRWLADKLGAFVLDLCSWEQSKGQNWDGSFVKINDRPVTIMEMACPSRKRREIIF